MKRMSNKLVLLLLCVLSLLSCSAEDLIRNSEVERWCGAAPCDWQVEGRVKRVGTWHPNDDAALIQENASVDSTKSDCFRFAMVAKVAPGAKVFLELDFLADGSAEFSQQLPESNWERRTFMVSAPKWYKKVRFIIRKEGPGRVILGEISAENADGRCSAPPIQLTDLPQGALCYEDDECESDLTCSGGRCGGCSDDSSCDAGNVCALVDFGSERYKVCVAEGAAPLGAACSRGEQCESEVCSDAGACSECASNNDCDDNSVCLPAFRRPTNSQYWPQLCGVGEGVRESGAVCTDDRDCESGSCQGFEVSCEPVTSCDQPICLFCALELHLGTCR
jgi:hypothetical protein